ncbi:hypothetical protein C8Q75DRAFT_810751 [Abortiporus biennis]|nr:hypothetical protein C8Q75DRAFT_810751 [Abortiporus biennis]
MSSSEVRTRRFSISTISSSSSSSSSSGSSIRKLRDIFHPKPKLSAPSSTLPYISAPTSLQPSRIPIRKKRSFRDVTNDEGDKGSALNPRAKVRQRLDSNASMTTVRGGISRKSSSDSIKTIMDSTPDTKPKRTSSNTSLFLNPGRGAPAKTVLSRSTSHNQVTEQGTERTSKPSTEKGQRNILPFPTRKLAALRASSAKSSTFHSDASSASTSLCKDQPSKAQVYYDVSRSRKGPSTSMIDTTSSSYSPHSTLRPRSHSRTSSNEDMTVTLSSEHTKRSTSLLKVEERHDKRAETALSPEDEMLRQVLEYVVNCEDDDLDSDNDIDELPPAVPPSRDSSLASVCSSRSFEDRQTILEEPKVFSESPSSSSTRTRLDRFDVKIIPEERHTAMWDLKSDEYYPWAGYLCISDKGYKPTGFQHTPPIRNIDIEFHSVDESTSILKSPPSSPDSSSQSTEPSPEYTTRYEGKTVSPQSKNDLRLDPENGICIENNWHFGPFSARDVEQFGIVLPPSPSYILKFFVPVPAKLFEGREYRKFKLKSKVVFGRWNVDTVQGFSGVEVVTIEHLKREVLMDGGSLRSMSSKGSV